MILIVHLQPLYSSPGESVLGRCQTSQEMKDPLAPGVLEGWKAVKRFKNGHAKYWPTFKICAQSWSYQSTPPDFISHLPVKPLFLFLFQPALSGKLCPAPVLQFSQALIARGWQECDCFVLLQPQIHFSLIFLLLLCSILRVFSCLGE